MKSTLEIVAEQHNDWIRIVKSFGCNFETAEDIVQEMYIKIHILVSKGTDVMYNETEINHYYIFRTLRSLFIDLTRKQSKIKIVSLTDSNGKPIEELMKQPEYNEIDDVEKFYEMVNNALDTFHWYDEKIYRYIEGGESIKGLSDKTTISYYSVYNTYNKVKKRLEKLINRNINKQL
jgi:DNA-directed RNA polymerase specialized sigma24 family protein